MSGHDHRRSGASLVTSCLVLGPTSNNRESLLLNCLLKGEAYEELQSIVDYETSDPAVASAFNNNCVASCTVLTCSCTGTGSTGSSYYWSSTTVPQQDVLVWTVGVSWGGMFPQFKTALQADFHFLVRAVRDGCVP